ncbi:MAG: EthD domain-containing protein [Microthrixaceae bacterium]
MVQLFAFLTRRSGTSREEFLDHWLNRHGPLIASTPELAQHIRRYEQHPRAAAGPESGTEHCDGVTVQWFDRLDDLWAFTAEGAYAELLAPDEAELLDQQRLVWVMTGEPTVVIGEGSGRSLGEALGDG